MSNYALGSPGELPGERPDVGLASQLRQGRSQQEALLWPVASWAQSGQSHGQGEVGGQSEAAEATYGWGQSADPLGMVRREAGGRKVTIRHWTSSGRGAPGGSHGPSGPNAVPIQDSSGVSRECWVLAPLAHL